MKDLERLDNISLHYFFGYIVMASKDAELLWKDFFRDPSEFWDDRNKKKSPTSPDFRHKRTNKSLWTNGSNTPPWVRTKLNVSSSLPRGKKDEHFALINMLKTCAKEKNLSKARQIHADLIKKELIFEDVYVATALLSTYAKCGAFEKALEVFEEIPVRNVVTWNALIAGYSQHGFGSKALECFNQMRDEQISPDVITYTSVLKACGIVKSLETGRVIDVEVRTKGLLQKDVMLGNSLVDMYAKCGALEKAQEVFDELPVRNVVTWNALITGYTQQEVGDQALKCFRQMQDEGISPTAVTYVCILKVCGFLRSLKTGEGIDLEIRKRKLLQKDVMLGNTLVDMYAKCGALEKAQHVFEQLPYHTVVSWTALISGYVENGLGDEALKCFQKMKDEGIAPNAVTYTCILKACGIVNARDVGEGIDVEVRKKGLLKKDILLGTAVVDMYVKCGAPKKAQEVFNELPIRDDVSWNALISGYVQHGLGDEALKCFDLMKIDGFSPNALTYVSILKACAIVRSLEIGEGIASDIRKKGLLQKDMSVGTALVDMYAKFGELEKAQKVFDELPVTTVLSWTALMAGYGQSGQATVVLELYREMRKQGILPSPVTILVLLTACSHAGLLEEGEKLFDDMCGVYKLSPTLEHYTCMIDLFSRAGHFHKIKSLFDNLSSSLDHLPLYLAILGACKKWVNVELGRWAFDQSLLLDTKCTAAYVCMESIYIESGMRTEANEIATKRAENKAWKMPGCCQWNDGNGNIHSFTRADESHPQSSCIYAKLEEIREKLTQGGYSLGQHWVSEAISDEEEKNVFCGLSEKLAIACALINSSDGMPIDISKNTEICEECHSDIMLISMVEKRKIQVNDAKFIHIFEGGNASKLRVWEIS